MKDVIEAGAEVQQPHQEFIRELADAYKKQKNAHERAEAERMAAYSLIQGTLDLPQQTPLHERLPLLPPERVTMQQLRLVFETHPEVALSKWAEMRRLARERLRAGKDAADTPVTDTWERVRFLALRDEIVEHHQIMGGIELQLADQMALSQWHLLKCLRRYDLHFIALWQEYSDRDEDGHLVLRSPSVSQHEATEQAMAHAERFQRMYARAVRSLVQLRKARTTINVIGAGQVNMAAQQQVNNAAK